MTFMFENLKVYQKAVDLAEPASQATAAFPRGSSHLNDQLDRAAVSIAANIAEGNGRYTTADRRNFFCVARGSTHECVPLLEICWRQDLITEDAASECKNQLERIAKMLSGLINWALQVGIGRNAPVPRRVEHPSEGKVAAIPQVGGLHHRYRRAA